MLEAASYPIQIPNEKLMNFFPNFVGSGSPDQRTGRGNDCAVQFVASSGPMDGGRSMKLARGRDYARE